jgi:hypothetical protein
MRPLPPCGSKVSEHVLEPLKLCPPRVEKEEQKPVVFWCILTVFRAELEQLRQARRASVPLGRYLFINRQYRLTEARYNAISPFRTINTTFH